MSKKNPVVLYIGSDETSAAFAAPPNWIAYTSSDLMDALARSIFDYPDAIIIDAGGDMALAQNAYSHLLTVNYPPMVILSDAVGQWDADHTSVRILPEHSTSIDIAVAINGLLNIEPTAA